MALPGKRETVTFRDAALIYKNFAGEKKQYNAEGDRNFSIMMNEVDAEEMLSKGWNVKAMRRREEEDDNLYHLKVKVNFANRPPRCWLVTNSGKQRTMLGEGLIGMFDHLESVRVDLEIVAFDWEMNGNTGRTAYLQSLFFHMYESELELEYAHVPQISSAGDSGSPKELESGARQNYNYDGEVED